jgi:3-(3-hydroxy-phenyl)propionate hydroxylase
VLTAVRRIPALAAFVTDSRTPPLRAGPLVDRRGRSGRRLAGALVPQPDVLVEGRRSRLDDVLGDGYAELRRTGDRLVVHRDGDDVGIEDPSGTLLRWLGRATAVQIRPDRIVRSASGRPRSGD